jgi:ribose 5-phosphate isomerase B
MTRKVLTEREVRSLPPGSPCYVERGALLTPLAREVALARQNVIVECDDPTQMKSFERLIALGADHDGWALKEQIKTLLQENNYWIVDCGVQGAGRVEALDLTVQVANQVRDRKVRWGIMIDGTGLTSCLVANKVPGIRAVHCYDRLTAKSSREYADSNLLTLAALMTTFEQADLIVMTWLNTASGKEGASSQAGKIAEIEQRFGQGCVTAVSGDPYCAL